MKEGKEDDIFYLTTDGIFFLSKEPGRDLN
jgi:hypothetical protein